MSDIAVGSRLDHFCPEVRGWAALRFIEAVPAALREEIENLRPPAFGDAGFRQAALAIVSTPEAICWSRDLAAAVPALGPAVGPACLARLWVVHLLRTGSGLTAMWPSVVAEVWNVVRPALEKIGIETHGPAREELEHEVAVPLALVFLKSLAAGRKDLRLLGQGDPAHADGPPLGWAPGIDALRPLLAYLLLGQVPGRFQSHAFLSSPFARLVRAAGLAVPAVVKRFGCPRCGVRSDGPSRACRQCGSPLVICRDRRLVARSAFERARGRSPDGREDFAADVVATGQAGACEQAEVHEVRRACVERAALLWQEILRGRSHGAAAVAVLGALAGVQPLAAIAARPPARAEWLENLVETLADARLDREPLARQANAVRMTVAAGLGLAPPPPILSAYVGVLATRFRHVVLGRGAYRRCV
jgi:hypothetical protein